MSHCVVRWWMAILLGGAWPAVAASGEEPALATTLRDYCVECHGQGGEINGEVDLRTVGQAPVTMGEARLLQRMLDAIEHREMPPPEAAPLPAATRSSLLAELQQRWQQAVQLQSSTGQAPMRRMNRFQYHNAVIDLFQLQCEVFTLPERMLREHQNYFQPATGVLPERVIVGSRPLGKSQLIEPRLDGVAAFPQDLRAEHGFDNQADHLSLSPLLMEAFLKLGQSITHSPDFTPQTVGIWDDFFAPPSATEELSHTLATRLDPFLSRAFRRPVDQSTLDRYCEFVNRELQSGLDFTAAMRSAAAAAIASPRFLYLYEQANQGQPPEAVSDLELATRLSLFLWGSIPDDRLLSLAATGQLHAPDTLRGEVARLLRDDKLKRFCDSFPSQWLQLERIISSLPDPDRYPEFYIAKYRASMHMMVEPLLLFEAVLIENLPLKQLLDADFTYRSRLLDAWYAADSATAPGAADSASTPPAALPGQTEVTTLVFRRQPVTDRRYGGVITNAAVLTMTSGRNRTQPITRGAWLATAIFNDPPPPPPADVPPLPETPAAGEPALTLREQLTAHRQRADCRGCHERIDPLGFALENFDPVGRWRECYDNGRAVDASGKLFHEHAFGDVLQFKQAIVAEQARFARGFVGHLLAYAVARPLEPSDRLAVDQILAATADEGYRLQSLIEQVVLSEPFRHKYNPSLPSTTATVNPSATPQAAP